MKIPHIIFIGHLWPEPDSSAAGYRTMALIDACLAEKWKVAFASAAEETIWSIRLKNRGVDCYALKINSKSFDLWIKEQQPDYIVFDRFMTEEQFSWRVEANSPDTALILDTCDLHFLRRARQQYLKTSDNKIITAETSLNLQTDDSIREISSIYRCDLSLIISSYEMDLLINQFQLNKQLLLYLPFMFDSAQTQQHPGFSHRKHFFMIGNYLHEPNWDAVLWCKQKIWPAIRNLLPQAQCHIYGAYTPDKAKQLHQPKEGFYIMGRAENIDKLIQQYRVNLVPLRFGAGIKGKVADGFRLGLPCVSTSIGAEGMAKNLTWGGIIADDENNFADGAYQLYTNSELWHEKQLNAYEIIKSVHNKQLHQPRFIKQLQLLKENLKIQRHNNFTGSMLKYHLHRSHKFMSRWIEEKNK